MKNNQCCVGAPLLWIMDPIRGILIHVQQCAYLLWAVQAVDLLNIASPGGSSLRSESTHRAKVVSNDE